MEKLNVFNMLEKKRNEGLNNKEFHQLLLDELMMMNDKNTILFPHYSAETAYELSKGFMQDIYQDCIKTHGKESLYISMADVDKSVRKTIPISFLMTRYLFSFTISTDNIVEVVSEYIIKYPEDFKIFFINKFPDLRFDTTFKQTSALLRKSFPQEYETSIKLGLFNLLTKYINIDELLFDLDLLFENHNNDYREYYKLNVEIMQSIIESHNNYIKDSRELFLTKSIDKAIEGSNTFMEAILLIGKEQNKQLKK